MLAREDASAWDDVRHIADEIELAIHLSGKNARDRWRVLRPRLAELESSIEHPGDREDPIDVDLALLGAALQRLRYDVMNPA